MKPSPELPSKQSFLNYRGIALVESDYQSMLKLEKAISSPIPHLYDDYKIRVWPQEPTMMDDTWDEQKCVPWRGILRHRHVTGLSLYDAIGGCACA